jgi:hypothetical protein
VPVGQLRRSAEADRVWEAAYRRWAEEAAGGLVGALTARLDAHALRLSVAYALLDGTATIGPEHVQAAVAVVDYSEVGARYVFGTSLGDDVAGQLLAALREAWPEGLGGAEQDEVFGHNLTGGRLALARQVLAAAGMAQTVKVSTGRPGRPRLLTRAVPVPGWQPSGDGSNGSTDIPVASENGVKVAVAAHGSIPDGGSQGHMLDPAPYDDPAKWSR